MVLGLPNKPSIAAQPFANTGGVLDDAASIDGIGGEACGWPVTPQCGRHA